MKKLSIYTFSQWNEMILDIPTQQSLIHRLKAEGKIGISYGKIVKLYAQLDEVGRIKYVHRDLVEIN